ncbi:Autotransporter assembly factor TamA [Thalassovita mediterranea]|uniref:Autotransporter assembly factor TamA n=1 Tax=Thalassovita mediterranea TaxID=340021 RepID=A0A0P1GNT2_9RHOB|nr:Autotransporter assembly factor TamA [Thalassovita mediterranea]SIS27603.1 autotransporter secretion outer membrane protein TamA [Thalassovita mediterranea]
MSFFHFKHLLHSGVGLAFCIATLSTLSTLPANAQETEKVDVTLNVLATTDSGLQGKLRAASLLRQAATEEAPTAQDYFAAALADYRRLTEVLYANGYYSGLIEIRLNGQEAALIPVTAPPKTIRSVAINVRPGKPFRFGTARIAPLPANTAPTEGFQKGARANAETVIRAARDAQTAWRDAGHAKVRVSSQDLSADHARQQLDATIALAPGPKVTFGRLLPDGEKRVRAERIQEIAGLPSGETFTPAAVDQAATRLRRSGAFRSVSLREADALRAGDVLDVEASLVDAAPRRFGAGVEIATETGLQLSGFWMHRNLLGGAERLRIEGAVRDIGTDTERLDYSLSARLDRPASFGPDTTAFLSFDISSEQEPLFDLDVLDLGFGASRQLRDDLKGEVELSFSRAEADTALGTARFTLASVALSMEWDRRDNTLNPTNGHFLRGSLTPYLGLDGTESGAQATLDGRIYRPVLNDRLIAAARLQFGAVAGSSIAGTQPNLLFQSGGGGTVRGQPFQSLGVGTGSNRTGGRSFLGLSGELRGKINNKFSLVGFADAGYIGSESFVNGDGDWHAGAGLGLRYDTVVGPIRLDVATPIRGDSSDRVQIYVGIGQAF